jgi:hypothetical protein
MVYPVPAYNQVGIRRKSGWNRLITRFPGCRKIPSGLRGGLAQLDFFGDESLFAQSDPVADELSFFKAFEFDTFKFTMVEKDVLTAIVGNKSEAAFLH